jgi:hypothetical protein
MEQTLLLTVGCCSGGEHRSSSGAAWLFFVASVIALAVISA